MLKKILVPIKHVVDYRVKIRIKPDNSGVDTSNLKKSPNPFDEIALEEAVRLKSKLEDSEIIAISIGDDSCHHTLRAAFARGADRAIHIPAHQELHSLEVAKILKAVVDDLSITCVIMGKQAIDTDRGQVPQMVAALLDWPDAAFVSKLDIDGDHLNVEREVDGGLARSTLSLPCVLSCDLRLNTPSYLKLPKIMQAKKKTIETYSAALTSIEGRYTLKEVKAPPQREKGVMVSSLDFFLETLKKEVENV